MNLTETTQNAQLAMSLEEQIARLQALLEASRQVHATIVPEEVMLDTARVLVRELEMEGAGFVSAATGALVTSYGIMPETPFDGCQRFDLHAKDGTVLATLVVAVGREGCRLTMYEQDFIEGLVLQAAVALENALYHERDLQWARVQQDLEAARGIQRSLLPKRMPAIHGVSVAARTVTCYEVGGDYLDVVEMPDGSHLFVVADVAGKGLASAIVATSFRSAFRALTTQPMTLAEMASRVGQHHWEEGQESRRRYVTAIFVRFHPAGGLLEVVNAGHNPAALIGADGALRMIEASGTPLGLLPGMQYTAESFPFPAGSKLLLYTDGLTEVFRDEEEFGAERLAEAFREMHTLDAEESLEALWAQLQAFSTGGPQTDDMTALALIHQPGMSAAADHGQAKGTAGA
ncbi:MAG TPA: PP2C family protein-serine/threonine phosphatase [Acidobacteriaceae bacterium]|nr:PP2C family protein-serine/threonine phosphatase [Acidobacteriaceae bacterium]